MANKMLFKTRHIFSGDALKKSTWPVFPMAKYFGLLPYDKEFKILKFWIVYSTVFLFSLVSITSILKFSIVYFFSRQWMNKFAVTLFFSESLIESSALIAHSISIIRYPQSYEKVLIGLRDLPEQTTKNLVPRYGPIIILSQIIFIFSIHTVSSSDNGIGLDDLLYYLSSFSKFVLNCLNLLFCTVLEILRYHFREISTELKPSEYILLPLTKRHNSLIDLTTTWNELFSWQLLIMCTRIFVKLVSSLFDLINNVTSQHIGITVLINSSWTSLWQIILLFALAISCEKTTEKANDFNNELFKLMRESKNLCSNEKLHLYVTMKQSLNFTACGFFTLGYPLVTSIIAAATTYLVILVQFMHN